MIDRLLPASAEPPPPAVWREASELAVLGACLMSPEAAEYARHILPVEAFYSMNNRAIWQAMIDVVDAGRPLDAPSIGDELRAQGHYERIGGAAYLDRCADAVPCGVGMDLDVHIEALLDAMRLREALLDCHRIAATIARGSSAVEVSAALASSATAILPRASGRQRGDALRELRLQTGRRPIRFPCAGHAPGTDLGAALGPLWPGQIAIVAAQTRIGKTAFMGTLSLSLALSGVPVAYLTLEDSDSELEARFAAALTWINSWRILENQYRREREAVAVDACADRLRDLPLWVRWLPGATREDVGFAIRQAIQHHGARLIVVDYVQKIGRPDRVSEYDAIDGSLGEIFRALGKDAACLLGSQLSRAVVKDGKPSLSHLRGSGSLEEKCRKAILLSRSGGEEFDDRGKIVSRGLLIEVAKNTSGEEVEMHGTFHVRHSTVWPGSVPPAWSGAPRISTPADQEPIAFKPLSPALEGDEEEGAF